ncbi:MAG: hypothetical protein WBZ40_02630 [Acidimicrobiia bacterium]
MELGRFNIGRSDDRFLVVLASSIGVAIAAAALMIPFPFMGDQALFTVFARMLNGGATLYRDLWDVKQPGIFWFYEVAGRVFSPDELGAHVLDAMVWIGASIWLAFGMRHHVQRKWVAALLPIACAAWYFLVADTNELTQVESLISPMLAGMMVLIADRDDHRAPPLSVFVAGLLGGVILGFKLLAGLIPLVVLLASILLWRRAARDWRTTIRGLVLPYAVGAAIPVAAVVVWILANNLVDVLRFAWFEYPPQMLGAQSRPLSRLATSASEFALSYATIGTFAIWRLIRPGKRGRSLTWILVAGCTTTVLVILLQLWWSYLFFALAAPVALLAIQGIDDLLDARRGVLATAAMVAILGLVPFGAKALFKVTHFDGYDHPDRTWASGYERALSASEEADFVAGSRLYVLGDPLVLYQLEANQGEPVNGWSPEFWTTGLWARVTDDLVQTPVEGLFLRDDLRQMAGERYPSFEISISRVYEPRISTPEGEWLFPIRPNPE